MNKNYNISASLTSDNHYAETPKGLPYKLALFSLLLLVFIMPWANGVHDGLLKIIGMLVFSFSGLLLVTKGTHDKYSFYHLFVVLLIVWIVTSLAWSPDKEFGKEVAFTLFQFMLLTFVITLILDDKNTLLLAYESYVIGCIIAFAFIFYNFLTDNFIEYNDRYTIANIDTDLMSYILALGVPMAAYLAENYQKRSLKLFNLIAIPIIMYAIILTGTRTGFIASLIGILYWLFTQRKANIKVKISMIFIFIVAISAMLSYAPKYSVDRLFSSGESIKSGTLNYRTVIWNASLEQWKEAPIIGTGVGGLYDAISKKHVNYNWAHNNFIHILTENGIIGLALYLMMLVSLLYYIFNSPFDERIYLLCLLGVAIISQLALHTHVFIQTWLVYTLVSIHSFSASRRRLH